MTPYSILASKATSISLTRLKCSSFVTKPVAPTRCADAICKASGVLDILVNLLNLMLVPVIAIYWLNYRIETISTKIVAYLPAKRRAYWHERILEVYHLLGGYLRGQLLASLLLAAVYIVGLFAFSTPPALFIGLAPALTLSFLEHATFGTRSGFSSSSWSRKCCMGMCSRRAQQSNSSN